MRALRLFSVVLLCSVALFGQAEWPKPHWEKVETLDCRRSAKPVSSTVGRYQIQLVPVPDSGAQALLCRGYLVDAAGHKTVLLEDWDVSIYQGTGEDLFGDGNPGLVLEGYSGGAHCCYSYVVASLGETPLVLRPLTNQSPFYFFRDRASRQLRIMTSDGAFDYFDGLCHACLPFPRVVLRADAAGLHDVSAQFVEQYDSEIALAREKIGEGNIEKFLTTDFKDAKGLVLEIAFSYLYSGREAQAWQTLDEMWPAADRDRIKRLIVKTRENGLLSRLGKNNP